LEMSDDELWKRVQNISVFQTVNEQPLVPEVPDFDRSSLLPPVLSFTAEDELIDQFQKLVKLESNNNNVVNSIPSTEKLQQRIDAFTPVVPGDDELLQRLNRLKGGDFKVESKRTVANFENWRCCIE